MFTSNYFRSPGIRTLSRFTILLMVLGIGLTVGCARKTGVTKESKVNEPAEQPKPTPPPAQPQPSNPDETITKNKPGDENVSGEGSSNPIKTEPIAEIGAVYFMFDKYDLSEDARATLAKNAQWLKQHSDIKLRVEGNCDERGTVEYNIALGEKRANAVKDYYISLGISATRVETVSYGKERPVDAGHTEDAWAKNRRADTVKKLSN